MHVTITENRRNFELLRNNADCYVLLYKGMFSETTSQVQKHFAMKLRATFIKKKILTSNKAGTTYHPAKLPFPIYNKSRLTQFLNKAVRLKSQNPVNVRKSCFRYDHNWSV